MSHLLSVIFTLMPQLWAHEEDLGTWGSTIQDARSLQTYVHIARKWFQVRPNPALFSPHLTDKTKVYPFAPDKTQHLGEVSLLVMDTAEISFASVTHSAISWKIQVFDMDWIHTSCSCVACKTAWANLLTAGWKQETAKSLFWLYLYSLYFGLNPTWTWLESILCLL